MQKLKVLVYGATGSQASPVVNELLLKAHHPVAVTHSNEKARLFKDRGIDVVVADMNDAARVNEITKNIDAISLMIPFFLQDPSEGIRYAKNAIDAAVSHHVKLIVWNASGIIPEQTTGNASIDNRIDVKRLLQKSGIPHITFQPSMYIENLLGPWSAPFIRDKDELTYPVPEDIAIGWIPTRDVAALIVSALERPEMAGHSFQVSGLQNLNGVQLAGEFSKALGRTIRYRAMPPKEFGSILDKAFGDGAGDKAAQEYEKMWATRSFPPTHFGMSNVLEKFPIRMTPIVDWVKSQSSMFTKSITT
jgi:uncharacterized protein YbjT (DUF2867 family)